MSESDETDVSMVSTDWMSYASDGGCQTKYKLNNSTECPHKPKPCPKKCLPKREPCPKPYPKKRPAKSEPCPAQYPKRKKECPLKKEPCPENSPKRKNRCLRKKKCCPREPCRRKKKNRCPRKKKRCPRKKRRPKKKCCQRKKRNCPAKRRKPCPRKRQRKRCSLKKKRKCAKPCRRRCKPKKWQKLGPITSNGYLNYLRAYKRTHCGMKPQELVRKAAKQWNKLPECTKDRYRRQACKVSKSCKHKRRKVCTRK